MIISLVMTKMNLRGHNVLRSHLPFRKLLYGLGNIFCITPWYDFKNAKMMYPIVNILYAVLCGTVFGTMLIWLKLTKSRHYHENIIEHLLLALLIGISIYLIEYLILGSIFIKRQTWEMFLKKSSQIHEDVTECTVCANFNIQFIMGHFYFIAVGIYGAYAWFSSIGLICMLQITVSSIPEYYCFLCCMISSSMTLYIRCLYEDLGMKLEKQTEFHLLKPIKFRSEEKFINDILGIGKRFRNIYDLVSYYNQIFGPVTLTIFWHSIIQILRCANLVLRLTDNPEFSWTMVVSVLLGFTVSMAESAYIIFSCDQASSAGKKLRQLCHRLQENFDYRSDARNELFKLADIASSYEPKFTAANFFVINQGFLLKIVSIATTYLIVIIQFYDTVRSKYLKKHPEYNRTSLSY